jgi:DNA-binding CsgD family transcriptional regulator
MRSTRRRVDPPTQKGSIVRLSPREKDCLNWAACGKSSCDIGTILEISESTVNYHVKNAMRKLDTSTRVVAIIKAIEMGLIERPYVRSASVADG